LGRPVGNGARNQYKAKEKNREKVKSRENISTDLGQRLSKGGKKTESAQKETKKGWVARYN